MTGALTARQQQVLGVIRAHVERHGRPPTLREIGAQLGIRSTNGVSDHLTALEAKGALIRDGSKARGYRIVGMGFGSAGDVELQEAGLKALREIRRGNPREAERLLAEVLEN